MVCSFVINDNNVLGGDTVGLYVEAISDSGNVIGRECLVKIYEVDTLGKKRNKDDLLAEFSVVIFGNQEEGFYFTHKKTKRTDEFENELPEYEHRKSVIGNELPIPLKYTPPYFKLFFDSNEDEKEEFIIIIQNQEDELELGTYEIGFTVELENNIIFDSREIPVYVECHNLLAYNCLNAAKFIIDNHYKHQEDHLCGLYHGTMFPYQFKSTKDYIRHARGRISARSIRKYLGEWDEEYKKIFDKHNTRYKIRKTDCFGFVIEALELGFKKTCMEREWKKCMHLLSRKMSGQVLAKYLTDLGWIALYYSPDINNFYDLDLKGVHVRSYLDFLEHSQYGNNHIKPIIPVYDSVINYSPTIEFEDKTPVEDITIKEEDKIKKVMKIPFAFLLAKYGRHTALLSYGQVHEVHWIESCYSDHLFDTKKSFLYDHTSDTWDWLSGVIVTPKVFWETEEDDEESEQKEKK
jgi:hypothetical protein